MRYSYDPLTRNAYSYDSVKSINIGTLQPGTHFLFDEHPGSWDWSAGAEEPRLCTLVDTNEVDSQWADLKSGNVHRIPTHSVFADVYKVYLPYDNTFSAFDGQEDQC
jgi:hypothetical protein